VLEHLPQRKIAAAHAAIQIEPAALDQHQHGSRETGFGDAPPQHDRGGVALDPASTQAAISGGGIDMRQPRPSQRPIRSTASFISAAEPA
jgi:hypothetical protein